MFGLVEFTIRLLIRFGALAGFMALALLFVCAAVMLARAGFRPAQLSALWLVCFPVALIGMALLAAPAKNGLSHLQRAFAARHQAPPQPSGRYSVGDATLTLTPIAAQDAPIEVRIWFPNSTAGARRLILYAPGLGGDRNQNALTAANLASHGYVVVAFDDLARESAPPGETAEARFLREGPNDFSSLDAYHTTLVASDMRVDLQAKKARDILDRIAILAATANAPWRGRLDVEHVGFVGYSFGGAVAAEASLLDTRIVTVVNIDGALFGRAAQSGVSAPYLLVLSDMRQRSPIPRWMRRSYEYLLIDRELEMARDQARRPGSEVIEVHLSEHAAFTDAYFHPENFHAWLTLDPFRAHDILQTRLLSFLGRTLPVDGADAETPPRRYEEVLQMEGRAA